MALTNAVSAKVLYISYDGLTDPLGQSQILPYLKQLSQRGHRITLLTCEKPDRMASIGERIRRLCNDYGLHWRPLAYHKYPPILSSAFDAAMLERAAIKLHRSEEFDIVHCRSYIPARAGLALKQRFGVRFLFDMRGFWPDEKIEGNSWNLANPLFAVVYRYFKRLESRLLRGADHIVSLTEAGKDQLLTRPEFSSDAPPITVIPCCVDFDHFALIDATSQETARAELTIPKDSHVIAYLGSIGTWYMLDEMLDCFAVYLERHPGAVFLIVTPDKSGPIVRAAARRGISADRLVIREASREQVPQFMAAANAGIFFIRPVFSKTASSPTKMGEMLALGLPIVANAGVGDVAEILVETGGGVAITHFDRQSYKRALAELEAFSFAPELRRNAAMERFDVKLGVEHYDNIYRTLA